MDSFSSVDETVIGGVVADRKGNIKALAKGAGMKEQLSGCPYLFWFEDERIP